MNNKTKAEYEAAQAAATKKEIDILVAEYNRVAAQVGKIELIAYYPSPEEVPAIRHRLARLKALLLRRIPTSDYGPQLDQFNLNK